MPTPPQTTWRCRHHELRSPNLLVLSILARDGRARGAATRAGGAARVDVRRRARLRAAAVLTPSRAQGLHQARLRHRRHAAGRHSRRRCAASLCSARAISAAATTRSVHLLPSGGRVARSAVGACDPWQLHPRIPSPHRLHRHRGGSHRCGHASAAPHAHPACSGGGSAGDWGHLPLRSDDEARLYDDGRHARGRLALSDYARDRSIYLWRLLAHISAACFRHSLVQLFSPLQHAANDGGGQAATGAADRAPPRRRPDLHRYY
mmetsp:Transcript_63599/g.125787  ORF Transcript_63599/g.125787 Transcript_63599/m.125787 type:complete len:263 (+) Transcript_63599:256-1044(+)